jgi:hypothetical protein
MCRIDVSLGSEEIHMQPLSSCVSYGERGIKSEEVKFISFLSCLLGCIIYAQLMREQLEDIRMSQRDPPGYASGGHVCPYACLNFRTTELV